MSDVVELACDLIRRRSVTPEDAGCQALISARLTQVGFQVDHLRFGEVDNLWATHGTGGPTLMFLGHTDVVPSGPEAAWQSPPFEPVLRDGDGFCDRPDRASQKAASRGRTPPLLCAHPDREDQKAAIRGRTPHLYGRGAADMKGAVAAMVVALEQFVAKHPDHRGRVGLLLTSDEEGPTNLDGVRRVVEHFRVTGERIDWCVVGEPSAKEKLGDLIRVGRRGSLSGTLVVRGVQGHVAYPQLALNPIHAFAPALAELATERWDQDDAANVIRADVVRDFPRTSFQVSNLNAGTGATNVIPGELTALFNFRYSTASRADDLRTRTEAILQRHSLDFTLDWNLTGEPFLTPPGGLLRETVVGVCRDLCGIDPEQSTGGGTSDGRFIAPMGAEVVEIGPVNATIHKVDECVDVTDLEKLPALYRAVCERLLGSA